MGEDGWLTRPINSYYALLAVTLVGALFTMLILHVVYENTFYMIVGGYGLNYVVFTR